MKVIKNMLGHGYSKRYERSINKNKEETKEQLIDRFLEDQYCVKCRKFELGSWDNPYHLCNKCFKTTSIIGGKPVI